MTRRQTAQEKCGGVIPTLMALGREKCRVLVEPQRGSRGVSVDGREGARRRPPTRNAARLRALEAGTTQAY